MDRTDQSDALAEPRRHLDAQDGESATILLDALPAADRDSPDGLLLRARAHALMGEEAQALEALLRAGEAGATPHAVDAIYDQLDLKALPAEPELALLDWLAPKVDRFMPVLRHARRLLSARRFAEAETVARRASALNPASRTAHKVIYLSVLRSDTPERAVDAIRAALDSPAKDPRYPALKSTLAGMEVADRIALTDAMNARWPNALFRGGKGGDLTLSEPGGRTRSREQRAYGLVLDGQIEEAMALAHEVKAGNEGRFASGRKALLPSVIASVPGADARQRPLIVDDGAEVVRSAPSLTGVTLLGFTDLAHQLDYPIRFIDAFCAATGAASLFLRDQSYRLFIGGVGSLAPDRAGTIEALRQELVALNTTRLIVVGQSSGGFSAMSYGRELGAAGIYGMGIASSITLCLDGIDGRARALIGKLARTFPSEDLDLVHVLPTVSSDTPIELYYGGDQTVDRAHAEHLSAQENVTLHPLKGHGHHQVLPRLIADGRFQEWLQP